MSIGSRGWTTRVLAIVAIAGLVAGYGARVLQDALAEENEPLPTAAPGDDGPFRFVALGDSYISGEGAEKFFEGTNERNNRCRRASTSYPYLIGRFIGVTPVSAACSGARTQDVLTTAQYPKSPTEIFGGGPQIEILEETRDVDLVLLSIGGNDAGFSTIGEACAARLASCLSRKDEWLSNLDAVEAKLVEVYRAVRAAAPGARVFVVNYPNPLAEEYCQFLPTIDRKEYVFLREEFIPALNGHVAAAAAQAGVAVIDIQDAFASRRICEVAPRDAGANIVALSRTGHRGSFHPNEGGHALIARVVGRIVVEVWLESSPDLKPELVPSAEPAA